MNDKGNNMIKSCIFIVSLLICGCSEVPGRLLIMEANFHNARGMYTEAIESYLKALEYTEAQAFGEYGLGTVYFIMGEEEAALNRFANAAQILQTLPADSGQELRFRTHYNTGVVLFSNGDFSAASDSFRNALRIDGNRVEAKRNLELSLRSLAQENSDRSGGSQGSSNGTGNSIDNESMTVFFEFIRQRSLNRWRSMDWPEEDVTGPDY